MSEWKEYALSDLIEIKYGKDHKHLADGKFPLYGSGGIMRFVEKSIYNKESILIPRKGTLSNLFYVNEPFWSVDTMFWSKINQELVIAKYLYYTLKTHNLADLNVGSAVPSLTTEILNKVLVSIPGLDIQKNIAEILSSLDEKIELNNKINQELESLAQLLFKRWFVDFEFPNENGELYKSSGGEMADSELGEIPKGWQIGALSSIATLDKSNVKPFEFPNKEFNHFSLPDYDNGKKPSLSIGNDILSSKYKVSPNSVLVSKLNPRIPRVWVITDCEDNCICSTEFQVVKPKSLDYFVFLCNLCSSEKFFDSLKSKVTGTSSSHQRVNPNDIINYIMPLPSIEIAREFSKAFNENLKIINKNIQENNSLSQLRDTLLPKLISGELQINDN